MGDILQSLKTSATKRQKHLSPTVQRRNRLLASIHLQIEAAKAKQDGKQFSFQKLCRIKNRDTGESIDISKIKTVRECWWVADDGKVYLEVRYGYKTLEIAKGKSSIEVGESKNLLPILEKLQLAANMGEFDDQINEASSKLAQQLRSKKSAK
jgi:hypothetical protein